MAHEDSAPVERSIRNPFLPAGDVVEEDFGGVLSDEHNVGIAMGSPPPNVQGIGMGPNGVFAIAGAPGIEPRIVRLGASVGTWRLERIDEGVASFVAGDGEQVEIRLR